MVKNITPLCERRKDDTGTAVNVYSENYFCIFELLILILFLLPCIIKQIMDVLGKINSFLGTTLSVRDRQTYH